MRTLNNQQSSQGFVILQTHLYHIEQNNTKSSIFHHSKKFAIQFEMFLQYLK